MSYRAARVFYCSFEREVAKVKIGNVLLAIVAMCLFGMLITPLLNLILSLDLYDYEQRYKVWFRLGLVCWLFMGLIQFGFFEDAIKHHEEVQLTWQQVTNIVMGGFSVLAVVNPSMMGNILGLISNIVIALTLVAIAANVISGKGLNIPTRRGQ